MDRVYKFSTELQSGVDVPSFQSMPIYDDCLDLVGAFVLTFKDRVQGFVGGSGYPLALNISLGEDFFFTPVEGSDGKVTSAIVSDKRIGVHSVKIRQVEE